MPGARRADLARGTPRRHRTACPEDAALDNKRKLSAGRSVQFDGHAASAYSFLLVISIR
jgi:hypothetical protein